LSGTGVAMGAAARCATKEIQVAMGADLA
jgi:hypothetical protein